MASKKNIPIPEDSVIKDAIDTSDFKQSLVDTLQESNTARNEMKIVVHEILRQPDTIIEINEIVRSVDRKAMELWWSKFGFMIWSAFIFALGVTVTVGIQKFLSN